jgi:glycosyltransferase involved in cell wall biosynthesis
MHSSPERTLNIISRSSDSPVRCAYLLGGYVPHFLPEYAGENPQAEFQEFMQRNDTTAFDYGSLGALRVFKFIKFLKTKHFFAMFATKWRNQHDVSITSGEDIGILCALIDLLTGCDNPIVIITHGSYFGSKYWKYVAKLLRSQKHIHWACLSKSLARTLVDDHGFSPSQVHATGYGVDINYFQPSRTLTPKPLILAAGTANRDYLSLVSSMQGLDVDVRIAADSAWYPVQTDVDGLSIPANITVKSAGNYRGLRDLYTASTFVVVPMNHAKFACGYAVIVEAMAMGKTVISTRTDAISDFIIDGENGFLVDVGDVDTLKKRITFLLDNPSIAERMGEKARSDIEKNWSLAAYSSRLEEAVMSAYRQTRGDIVSGYKCAQSSQSGIQ